MKFSIKKGTKKRELVRTLVYRPPSEEIRAALIKAMEEQGLSAQKLLDQMVQHCLKETRYL